MNERAWLKQVLTEANVSNHSRPDWAKNYREQLALNSQFKPNSHSDSSPNTSGLNEKRSGGKDALKLK